MPARFPGDEEGEEHAEPHCGADEGEEEGGEVFERGGEVFERGWEGEGKAHCGWWNGWGKGAEGGVVGCMRWEWRLGGGVGMIDWLCRRWRMEIRRKSLYKKKKTKKVEKLDGKRVRLAMGA